MKKRKIVIVRGMITGGKTTISHAVAQVLPGWIFIDIWKIKEMFEPLGLKDRTHLKEISKKAALYIMKETMRKMQCNIIVQESSQKYIRRYLEKDIKKYNYELYSFFLDVEFKEAEKRDRQREKPTMQVNKDNYSNEEWHAHKGITSHREDMIINSSKHSVKEIVNIILKGIGEKRKNHPHAHLIRKTW